MDRSPPSNLDAEGSVLSACFIWPASIDEIIEIAGPEDMYADANRRIFRAILDVREHGSAVDATTVAGWLRKEGRLDQVGGTAYLAQIIHATPAVANVADHAKIIRELSAQRRALAELQRLTAEAYAYPGNTGPWLEDLERTVHHVVEQRRDLQLGEELGPVVMASYKQIGAAAAGEATQGLTTGLPQLDDKIGGLASGDLVYVAGRPGMGKTSAAWGMATAALDPGVGVDGHANEPEAWGAFFSLEMKRHQLALRAIAHKAEVSLTLLRRGKLDARQWARVLWAANELQRIPLIIDDARGLTTGQIRSRLRRYAAIARRRWPKAKLRLIGVDYLQLLESELKGANPNERIEASSNDLKTMAGDFDACVLALSQLNRAVEARDKKDRRPTLADLRGSGAIEQDADNILFIYREDYYREQRGEYDAYDGLAEFIIGKGRNSGAGFVLSKFEGLWTRFYPADGEQPQAELGYQDLPR